MIVTRGLGSPRRGSLVAAGLTISVTVVVPIIPGPGQQPARLYEHGVPVRIEVAPLRAHEAGVPVVREYLNRVRAYELAALIVRENPHITRHED